MPGHKNRVNALTQLRDGTLISVSNDKHMRRWNLKKENALMWKVQAHDRAIVAVVESQSGLVCTGSIDRTVKVWEINEKKCVHTINVGANVAQLLQLPGNYVACLCVDHTLYVIDVTKGEHKATTSVHYLANKVFLARGEIITWYADRKMVFWDWRLKKIIQETKVESAPLAMLFYKY
jgi:F-box and WD-40 domain protein CDC4